MRHIAWDRGIISGSMMEAFGLAVEPKTAKTLCGKRVAMDHISNDHSDCLDCRRELREQRRFEDKLTQMLSEEMMVPAPVPTPEEERLLAAIFGQSWRTSISLQ